MAVRLLRAADRTPVPWKNGGGVTTEVAAYPPGAGFEDFDWRVSFAQVDADGPFSIFPGIDRVLVLLEGAVSLDIEGRAPVELTPVSLPLAFDGDIATSARVQAGPALDLNVMVRRDRVTAEVVELPPQHDIAALGGPALLIVTEGEAVFTHPGGALSLHRFDALQLGRADGGRAEASAGARVFLAAFRPAE